MMIAESSSDSGPVQACSEAAIPSRCLHGMASASNELAPRQSGEYALPAHQVIVASALHDPPPLQNVYAIRVLHRAESMGDDHGG